MGFSKIRSGGCEEIFITEVQDGNHKTLEKWVVNKRDYHQVLKILNNKFGLNLIIKERVRDNDLDWALR